VYIQAGFAISDELDLLVREWMKRTGKKKSHCRFLTDMNAHIDPRLGKYHQ